MVLMDRKISKNQKNNSLLFRSVLFVASVIASFHMGLNANGYNGTQHSHTVLDDTIKQTAVHQIENKETAVDKNSSAVLENTLKQTAGQQDSEYLTKGEELFYETAKTFKPVTDKVTTHMYQIVYGRFLMPYYHQNPTMKFLEIGLGCNMNYGPGASVAVWKKLFPRADLWEAEYDAACVEKHRDGMLKGINLLTGDQGNKTVLDSWIETSGGNFDVVVDDGGHQNCQILHSFEKLWPTVKPGGLYFIEDMQVAKSGKYTKYTTDTCDRNFIMPDKLKKHLDILIHHDQIKEFAESDVEFIFCQHEACVLGKKKK